MFNPIKKAHQIMLGGANFIESLNRHPLGWLIKLLDKIQNRTESKGEELSDVMTEQVIKNIVKTKDVFKPIKNTKNAQRVAYYVYKLGRQDKTVAERFLKEYEKITGNTYLTKRAYKYLQDKKLDEHYKNYQFSKSTLIDGTEELMFMESSTPLSEKIFGITYEKGNKRMVKTIANYIKRLDYDVYLKRTAWNSFLVLNWDNDILLSLTLADNPYITEQAQESKREEYERLYKVSDIKELINYITKHAKNAHYKENENFSIVDWMYEHRLSPENLFRLRIMQSINYCRNNHLISIRENENVMNYIKSYLDTIFQKSLKNPGSFDFIKGLRLALYVPPGKYGHFKLILDLVLNRLKGENAKNEVPPYVLVNKLHVDYCQLVEDIFDYCDRQIQGKALLV